MNVEAHEVTEVVAAGLGAFVVLAGAATLIGMPWQYQTEGPLLAIGRILGAVLSLGVGLGIAWIALRA
jgi:hypothetical protein